MTYFQFSWYFINQEEVEVSRKEFFTSKNKNWYQFGIKELAEKHLQMVQHDGFYFECKAAFIVTWRIEQISF